MIVGLAGLDIAPIIRPAMREPKRGGLNGANAVTSPATLMDLVRTLIGKPSFWELPLGAASSSMMGYGLIFWLPSFFVRSFGEALPGFFAWMPAFLVPENPSAILSGIFFYVVAAGLFTFTASRLKRDWEA